MATYMPSGGGCQANERAYYSATRWDSRKRPVIANARTNEEAERLADERLAKREEFYKLSPREQLQHWLDNQPKAEIGRWMAFELLCRIVLED